MRLIFALAAGLVILTVGCSKPSPSSGVVWQERGKTIELSSPDTTGGMTLNAAIARRRSRREFDSKALSDAQISQLCWAAQGITDTRSGKRVAPSAGGLYPITVLVVDTRGVFEYRPKDHSLIQRGTGDARRRLQLAALDQSAVGDAPACLVIGMNVSTTAAKYGRHAEQYCLMEAGHVAQNLLLSAASLELVGVPIGAFHERSVSKILKMPSAIKPVYLIPIGQPVRR